MTLDTPLLSHSAQEIDNLKPDIIYQGKKKLDPLENKAERQDLVLKMDDVISAGKKISSSPKVIVYYKQDDFVLKTIPDERDSYNRLAPILSYGQFPGNLNPDVQDNYIERIKSEIIEFVNSIGRSLSLEAKEAITEVLKSLAQKKRMKKTIILLLKNFLIYSGTAIVPLALGWVLHEHIPQMLQPLLQQNPQPILTKPLQEVLQTLVWLLAVIVAISNVLMMFIFRLTSMSLMNGHKKKQR